MSLVSQVSVEYVLEKVCAALRDGYVAVLLLRQTMNAGELEPLPNGSVGVQRWERFLSFFEEAFCFRNGGVTKGA